MQSRIRNLVAGGAIAAGLLGTGVAYAQDDSTSTTTPPQETTPERDRDGNCHIGERREEIDDALAEQLGITADDLATARRAAQDAVMAELGEVERPQSRPETEEEREALREQFESRKDLFDQKLAEQLGISVDELTAARLAVAEARLAERVAEGDLTQEEADERLDALRSGEAPMGDMGGPFGRGHGGRGHGGRGPR
jgi:hypothetical protein